jgi:amidase
MSQSFEFARMDGMAQADLVRRKEVSAIEIVEAAIDRLELINPAINAVVTPMYENARKSAEVELPEGPLSGVPMLLKDLLASCAGVRMTSGSAFLRDFIPDHDSTLVSRLKSGGLLILGKTNTPEFGLVPTTEPAMFGPSRNPWDRSRTTGGSSGGSAAAVAAGIVPVAHANDGGGSIRIPASCCGVFGLKPTRARNPLGPDFGDMFTGLVSEHAVTRSVRDSAALLDITSGLDLGDPYCAPAPSRPFLQEVGADPGRLRIGFTTASNSGAPVHEDCVKAVLDAAKLCADLGHIVEEASPSISGEALVKTFMVIWSSGLVWMIDGYAHASGREPSAEDFEPGTWALYQMGQKHSAANYLLALQQVQWLSRLVAQFFAGYDVWLTPTLAQPPLQLGAFEPTAEDPLNGMRVAAQFVPFTPISNATGQPAMSVPLYWNDAGLPIGTQFVGRFGDEATLFRLAAQLEAARPWTDRFPDLEKV